MYSVDLNIPLLLISGLPAYSRNFLTIPLCLMAEMSLEALALTWVFFAAFMILSFILTTIQASKEGVQQIR
jgi:hypothetical protein